ncbi:ribosome biogenesis/translation initiation ATPase RLI [Candidatus Woesearchaeota archaeon]|nr:ribosome biogenesis/translation initiation ATPase RLI [Candidatus Woesearchaeota archaeon]
MARIAIVKKKECNPTGCGGYLCAKVCPINRKGEECIKPSPINQKAQIDETLCIGCGICPNRCPFQAIDIINLPEEFKNDPIHRYGENGFALYSLPTPMFGKVVGVLGVNGIGKSTAIKIVAGVLKPNLGRTDGSEAGYDELISFFKGTEAQNFFEKVRDGKITTSYKPQTVDSIPKQFSGTVKELLSKADQKGMLKNVADVLELNKIMESDIARISGGELQRVAIAATVLKKANLYIFDEPTSYLDIKQRIKVSRFIRELADADTAVLVIEHDMIILDYITDLVHIMYGKEGGFGVVSMPKTTRMGINIFLDGYLKEENMRFRDYPIKFAAKQPVQKAGKDVQCGWTGLRKKLGNFILSADKGELYKNDVVGIVGENGIGKTSFVKILADTTKPDAGKIDGKITVSYKPQYLEGGDDLVMTALGDALDKYDAQIIRPLNIKPLLMKKLNELSGGELQKVAIALCLSRKADLYLLDEPSAYLDVEQRIRVSKIIADVMEHRGTSALVVDHDLIFIDYLSKKLLVFEGEPAVHGSVAGPFDMQEGMNSFLTGLEITMRRDEESLRPRINKQGSQKDREQRNANKLYYA